MLWPISSLLIAISHLHSVRSFHTKLNEIPSAWDWWAIHDYSIVWFKKNAQASCNIFISLGISISNKLSFSELWNRKNDFFFSYPDLYTYYYVYSSNWLCAMFFGFLLRRFLREIAGLDPAPTFVREHKARCAMSWWRIYLWPLSHWFPSYCTLLLPDVVLHLAILLGSVHMIGFESWIDLCHTDRFRKIK